MVNLELYRVFYTVAKYGSSTRAAEELFVSQPAVSQSIRQLENQLGIPLFNRTHNGMELSAHGGKLIFNQVEQALKLLEEAENTLVQKQPAATGVLKIGATDAIFSYVLADKIVKFNEKYPAIKIELITGTTPETLTQLKEGKCDLAFVNLPIEDRDVIFTGTISHLNDVFVAGDKFAKLKGQRVNLADLQQYPLIMIDSNTIARRALANYGTVLGIHLTPDVEVENWDLMLKLAVAGMGIGCVPREYAQPLLDSGELFELDVVPALPVRGIGICLAKKAPVPFAVKEFTDLFD